MLAPQVLAVAHRAAGDPPPHTARILILPCAGPGRLEVEHAPGAADVCAMLQEVVHLIAETMRSLPVVVVPVSDDLPFGELAGAVALLAEHQPVVQSDV